MTTKHIGVPIERVEVSAYSIPTDALEADGTLSWTSTTLVLVEVTGVGYQGLGYTYADLATATLIKDTLAKHIEGMDAMNVPRCWEKLVHEIRNLGRSGISSMAISAVDVALWDLKARVLDLPLVTLLGAVHDGVPVYGSGGFTTYSTEQLQRQLGGWVAEGISRVKMKIGTHPRDDLARVRAAREAIGANTLLMVDANGAYTRKQALEFANKFAELGVIWFEEPVSSDDLEGLHLMRDRGPAGMQIAAGEYGYDLVYFRRMLDAEAVDILQADATRCGGITGFLRTSALPESHGIPLSPHCAPTLHLAPSSAVPLLWPIEYFHDHVRIEHMLFDGAPRPRGGKLYPDLSRPGMGIEFKRKDAARYAV